MTYDGNAVRLYVNGNLDLVNESQDQFPSGYFGDFLIGGLYGELGFFGDIDEVSVWNRALYSYEINDLMSARPSSSADGLSAYWDLNERDGESIFDLTENNNDGSIFGGQRVDGQISDFSTNYSSYLLEINADNDAVLTLSIDENVVQDIAGNGNIENTFEITYNANAPNTPTGLKAINGNEEIVLNWDEVYVSDLGGYYLYESSIKRDIDGFFYAGSLDGHSYYISESGGNYANGIELCVELGGHLATINSQEEQDFILSIVMAYGNGANHVWLGLDDLDENGIFEWLTSEPLEFENWNSQPTLGHAVELTTPEGLWNSIPPTSDQNYRRYLLEIEEVPIDTLNATEFTNRTVTGLENYKEYGFKVSSYDTVFNESLLSSEVIGIPQSGENNRSLYFDGVNDYLNVPYQSSFNDFEDELTVFAWVKLSNELGNIMTILENGNEKGLPFYVIKVDKYTLMYRMDQVGPAFIVETLIPTLTSGYM